MLYKIVFVVLFVISLNCFSLRDFILEGLGEKITFGIFYFYILSFFINIDFRHNLKQYASRYYVMLFLILPLFTALSCQLTHGQSAIDSINNTWVHFILIVYFFLIKKEIKIDFVINVLTACMFVKLGLTIVEQFTYPYTPFAMRYEGYNEFLGEFKEQDTRSGIYRFLIADAYYLYLIVGFKSFDDLMRRVTLTSIGVFLSCCLGIYLDQTRQIMLSFVLSIAIISFIKSKRKIVYISVFVILTVISLLFVNVLFAELIEQTSDEANDDNIRLASYLYYLFDYQGPIAFLFGHGYGAKATSWGKFIQFLQVDLGLYRVDIGIIGAFHLLGIVFVIVFFLYYALVIVRNWNNLDAYIQMMFLSILINIPMIFPLYNFTVCAIEFFMGCLFFLVDSSIVKNSKLTTRKKFLFLTRMYYILSRRNIDKCFR